MPSTAYTNLTHEMALYFKHNAPPDATVELIEQDNGKWTVVINTDADKEEKISDKELVNRIAKPVTQLGTLSLKYESNGISEAIGYDNNGGWSFGAYQIASKTGTLAEFINFLSINCLEYSKYLVDAGGVEAAVLGDQKFKSAWRSLAKHQAFLELQHDFIKTSHYDVFARVLFRDLALNLEKRTIQLQNVAWSVSVQHGPNNMIFHRALKEISVDETSDNVLINLVYDERCKVDRYFKSSEPKVKAAILHRFAMERAEALVMHT